MDEKSYTPSRRKPTKTASAKLKGCTRLNVRETSSADATVRGVITDSDRIKIDLSTKDHEWINVVEPIFGYAKKEFLEVT